MIGPGVKREFSYPHRTIGEKTTVFGRIGEQEGIFRPFLCKTPNPVI